MSILNPSIWLLRARIGHLNLWGRLFLCLGFGLSSSSYFCSQSSNMTARVWRFFGLGFWCISMLDLYRFLKMNTIWVSITRVLHCSFNSYSRVWVFEEFLFCFLFFPDTTRVYISCRKVWTWIQIALVSNWWVRKTLKRILIKIRRPWDTRLRLWILAPLEQEASQLWDLWWPIRVFETWTDAGRGFS